MEAPEDIAPHEELGRGVSSGRNARRARRSNLPITEFWPRGNESGVSVDRLTEAGSVQALRIADRRDAERGRTFYGWAVIAADAAGRNGRRVVATPISDANPYHAEIVLPESAARDKDELRRHAQQLRDSSHWRDRSWSSEASP